jgi:DNA-binding GntR family transcriptional regulator
MSSRAVRKALKRMEAEKGLEKEARKGVPAEDEEEEEEEETRPPRNPFAMVYVPQFGI